MPYPIRSSQTVAVGQSMTLTFRPVVAGLVNVVVVGSAIIPTSPPGHRRGGRGGETEPPPTPVLALSLEVFAPGVASPVLSKEGRLEVSGPVRDRITVWGDVAASESELSGDWTARIANTGNLPETFDVTIRYQILPDNLGKVDHIVVLMMENRSFDHMLGYRHLSAEGGDVDGLSASDFNRDAAGNRYPVHPLASTNFLTDPGHGWPDVAGPLPGASPAPDQPPFQLSGDSGAELASNAGFVQNFAAAIENARQQPPLDLTDIPSGGSHTFRFRPKAVGTLGVRSLVFAPIPIRSETGLLGSITLHSPASTVPIAVEKARTGSGAITITHVVTAAELALAGDWTCEVTNNSDTALVFRTNITNAVGLLDPGEEEPLGSIMGYYDATTVPVYDSLARQFAICDRWFASIPTDTFPNRLYAMSGGAGGLLTTPPDASFVGSPPGYRLKSIFEVLQEQGVDWNIFFSDLPFALVFTKLAQDAQYTARMRPISEFLDRAATGDLPSVAWLDPNFNDVPDGVHNATDDHPPGDVARGQKFVAELFNALAGSPAWSKTLLIVTYDEHGGFYDHVQPPGTPPRTDGPKDDDPNLTRYGLRVPALIVSPWVAQGQVTHEVHDHTSILRTILLRFHSRALPTGPVNSALPGSTIPSMGARTDNANDLGPLLSLPSPRAATSIPPPVAPALAAARTTSPLTGIGATLRIALFGF